MLWRRALGLGILSWLILFAISFLAFPLKKPNAPLFENLLLLVVLLTAGTLFRSYFRDRAISTGESAAVGIVWLVINLVFDYPMFAFGPMKMTPAGYYSEIGAAYLVFPLFALTAARLAGTVKPRSTRP